MRSAPLLSVAVAASFALAKPLPPTTEHLDSTLQTTTSSELFRRGLPAVRNFILPGARKTSFNRIKIPDLTAAEQAELDALHANRASHQEIHTFLAQRARDRHAEWHSRLQTHFIDGDRSDAHLWTREQDWLGQNIDHNKRLYREHERMSKLSRLLRAGKPKVTQP